MAAVAWSPEALDDLEAVHNHLATSSPSFAAIYVKRLVRAVDGLETVPGMGRKVGESAGPMKLIQEANPRSAE